MLNPFATRRTYMLLSQSTRAFPALSHFWALSHCSQRGLSETFRRGSSAPLWGREVGAGVFSHLPPRTLWRWAQKSGCPSHLQSEVTKPSLRLSLLALQCVWHTSCFLLFRWETMNQNYVCCWVPPVPGCVHPRRLVTGPPQPCCSVLSSVQLSAKWKLGGKILFLRMFAKYFKTNLCYESS